MGENLMRADLAALLAPPVHAVREAALPLAPDITIGGSTSTARADRLARIEFFRSNPATRWLAEIDRACADGLVDHFHLANASTPIPFGKLTGRWRPCVISILDTGPAVGPAEFRGVERLLRSWPKSVLVTTADTPPDARDVLAEVARRTRVAVISTETAAIDAWTDVLLPVMRTVEPA